MGLRKFIRRVTRKAEDFVHRATGRSNIGESQADDAGGANRGPQFTDEARRQAAGAGTVGFTQRTQNY